MFAGEESGRLEGLSIELWALVVLWNCADVELVSYEPVVRPALRFTHCPGDKDVTPLHALPW